MPRGCGTTRCLSVTGRLHLDILAIPCHFAGGADHALRLELGNRLLVLLVAPVDVAALVDGSRRPEELVQPLLEQRVLARGPVR